MKLMDIYGNINNPLDDVNIMRDLVDIYAMGAWNQSNYYSRLVTFYSKEKKETITSKEDIAKFVILKFNIWKNSVLKMTKAEFYNIFKYDKEEELFLTLRRFLKGIPDVNSMEGVDRIFEKARKHDELLPAFEKFLRVSNVNSSTWEHVYSHHIDLRSDRVRYIEHRLYLNVNNDDIYKVFTHFIEKCHKYNLPFYFKFSLDQKRADNIVIYSDTETLSNYIEILEEIKKEYPELLSSINKPPILCGKIDGWIGYGSEPATIDDVPKSFNSLRAEILEKSIDKATKDWVMKELNTNINYNGKVIRFKDYIIEISVIKMLSKLENRYFDSERYDKLEASRKGVRYTPSYTINKLGYSLDDIKSSGVRENIFNVFKDKIPLLLTGVCKNSYDFNDGIQMAVRANKKISFSSFDLEQIIQKLSPKIFNNDPNFVSEIRREIDNRSEEYGIDKEKFCFDIERVERMRESDLFKSATNLFNKCSKKEVYDKSTITNLIDKNLLRQDVKLPNGNLIPAWIYIEEIVFPHLPKSGFIFLDTGETVLIKDFIEKYVLGECQEKYNGDFKEYLLRRVRNNIGAVSINDGNKKYIIYPSGISRYIEPNLLLKRVILPNGHEISGKDYIEKIYAPYIPADGKVILSNGTYMPVQKFIENKLLGEYLDRYEGDIGRVIYNKTRGNVFTVTANDSKIRENLEEIINEKDLLDKGFRSKYKSLS